MNWRAIPPALLWFTLLGPLLVTLLAALGLIGDVVDLGPSLADSEWVMLLALPYAYMLIGPTCLVAGLVFGVARGLSTRWLATRTGAGLMGALAGAFAGCGAVSTEFMNTQAMVASAGLGAAVGAVCGLITQWRAARASLATARGRPPG